METKELVPIKLNIGSGRIKHTGFTNIDCVQIIDGNGEKCVDIIMNIEKEKLPFDDNSVDEIIADAVLEHIGDLKFVLNECYRVLKHNGLLSGSVPNAGSDIDFRDPTHKRHFVKNTFNYFSGQAEWTNDKKPKHPRYADYGFLSWNLVNLKLENDIIIFKMKKDD